MAAVETSIRTFLIADVRGYSRYTDEYGDEAAARLAAKFAELAAEGVEAHGGELIELRGDEALVVFSSARQAIRAAVDLQAEFGAITDECDLPLRVGIGIDSGEAVQLEDGSFRGGALNVAARLCGRAHGGEVLLSEATARLAGRLDGLQFSDRGRVRLKNIPDPVHVLQAYSELDAPPRGRWVLMFFGGQGRTLGWRLGLLVVLVAAATAATVVYFTAGSGAGAGGASPAQAGGGPLPSNRPQLAAKVGLNRVVPSALWHDCKLQTVPEPAAIQTAVCLPASGAPDRWEISSYASSAAVRRAYEAQLRLHPTISRDTGKCNAFSWGGEYAWLHGPDKPGGRAFCYFDGNDAVIVWTHERLGQPTHKDVLIVAREGGSDHAGLTRWWRPWHHRIGKVE
jgi:class 3 adenylate cyclase